MENRLGRSSARPAELAELGASDGEHVWAIIHSVDALAIQSAFDEVHDVSMNLDNSGEHLPELTFEGELSGQTIVVIIYTQPFEDAAAQSVIRLPSAR